MNKHGPLIFGVVIASIIYIVAIVLSQLLFNDRFTAVLVGIMFGTVVYFPFIFPHCTVLVPANVAWLLSNSFKSESSDRTSGFSGYRDIKAQRELQSGLHWRYPWEVKSTEVDMQKKFYAKHDENEKYTLSDGKKLIVIKWQITIVPLPGYLVNYVKTSEPDIQRRIKARVESHLQGIIGDLDESGYGQKFIAKLREGFKNIYDGADKIHEDEIEMGIYTGSPEIIDIDDPKGVQEAKIEKSVLSVDIEAAQDIVTKANGKIDFNQALSAIYRLRAASNGNANIVDLANMFSPKGSGNKGGKKGGNNNQGQGGNTP